MENKMLKCPECGNIQPIDSQKCFKCGFNLNAYLNQINKSNNVNVRNNPKQFYEISPQWQAYVDRQRQRENPEEDTDGINKHQSLMVIGSIILMVLAVVIIFMIFEY